MNTIDKVLKIAQEEVGYMEKSNATLPFLYDKNTNAGDKNYTKYAQDLFPNLQAQPWCAMFVCWIFTKAYTILEAKKMLCGEFSAYTPTFAQHFIDKNQWYTSPKQGDIVFFKNSQRICHVGIVYSVNGQTFTTIEGNTSSKQGVIPNGGMVCVKQYKIGDTYIAGFGRPNYNTSSSTITTSSSNVVNSNNVFPKVSTKGIDVSGYNPIFDYKVVKNAGVEFAILKIIRKDLEEDKLFSTHLNGFKNVGIPISVYNYSYATTINKAKSDALKVIQILKNYGLQCTVYLDVEDDCQKNLGMNLIDIINAYQITIENAGLEFGLYTSMSFYNSYIKPYKQNLKCKKEWIARYPSSDTMNFTAIPDMSKKPDIGIEIEGWQYSSKGQVNGINGNVDMNIMFNTTAIPEQAPQKESPILVLGKTTANLNLRSNPTTSSSVITVIPKDTVIQLTGDLGDWYRTQMGGFVSKQYIQFLFGEVVDANKLNIRNAPNSVDDNNKIGVLLRGDKMTICTQTDEWYKILTATGIYGWVSKKYIKVG